MNIILNQKYRRLGTMAVFTLVDIKGDDLVLEYDYGVKVVDISLFEAFYVLHREVVLERSLESESY